MMFRKNSTLPILLIVTNKSLLRGVTGFIISPNRHLSASSTRDIDSIGKFVKRTTTRRILPPLLAFSEKKKKVELEEPTLYKTIPSDVAGGKNLTQEIKDGIENQRPWTIVPGAVEMKAAEALAVGFNEKDEHVLKPEHCKKLKELERAQEEFFRLTQEDADRIFNAVAEEANMQRLPLAKLAVEETKMGQVEDKVLKNGLACELIHDRYENAKTCGLIDDDAFHGLKTFAHPVGPVCALTPVTNPTSTAIAKALMMAKTRNAGIFLPHPKASKCTAEAIRICREAGERAGAPKGWLQIIEHPSMEDSNAVMRSDTVSLIFLKL
jgi:hypothetical protein